MSSPLQNRFLRSTHFVSAAYIVVATLVFIMWVWSADTSSTAINSDPRSKLSDLVYGTAHKPYVQRVLVPVITRAIHATLPQETWREIAAAVGSLPKVQKEMMRLGWEEEFLTEYLIAFGVAYVLFLPLPFLVKRLWVLFYRHNDEIASLAGFSVLMLLPTFFHVGPHYIYDLPALAFFAAGLLLLLQRRWLPYYFVFAAGSLNKETTLLLLFAFMIVYGRERSKPDLIRHTMMHIVIFLTMKLIIMKLVADAPGPEIEFHLWGNLHELLTGYTWSTLLIATVTLWLIFADLRQKPVLLVRLTWLVVPFAMLILFFGVVQELRAAYEILPILSFMMLHTIVFRLIKCPLPALQR